MVPHRGEPVAYAGGVLLESVRVLDLSGGDADAVTRVFADLGADVLKIEPPGGDAARTAAPTLAGAGIPFGLHNANKRAAVLDPDAEADRRRLAELAAGADIVVDSNGRAAAYGLDCAALTDRHRHLVAVTVSDFGTDGPRASWRATDAVFYALSGALSRSGPTHGTPVLPPTGIASATAAVQAAWATLAAYYRRLRCGVGDYLDFSRFDAVAVGLDPVFGTHGQTAAAQRAPERWRGRPRNQDAYPIFACRDGYVRICVMSPRQWHGLRAWLGEPERFQDPKFDRIGARFAAWPQISELVAALFADRTRAELVAAGQSHRVPIAAVLDPAEALTSDHFRAVGAIADVELVPGVDTAVPVGYFTVEGARAGFRTPAPAPGADRPDWATGAPATVPDADPGNGRPFTGLRILDLGIIVAGGETSRLFADLGAEVIKVESAEHPDGLRQTRPGQPMSESFAWAHRNSAALGLDLRSAEGAALFERLVAESDAVFANFKPGTLAGLGFDHARLRALNPRIVLAESSAFGDTGPWSDRMGYGPLVRATTGVTRLWTAPDGTAESGRHPFYDATTIFPDHVAGRVTAIAALAALIHRHHRGAGVRVHIAQTEVAVNQLAVHYVTEAARRDGTAAVSDGADLHLVSPAAGDDEWCVVSICDDVDWRAITAVLGRPELADDPRFADGAARRAHRAELTAQLSDWTSRRPPSAAATELQAAGIAAAPMNRPPELAEDPQLHHRKVFADMVHPLFDTPLPAETGPARYRRIPAAPTRPAPLAGADTRRICSAVLGLPAAEIERLIEARVLFSATG